jgi:ABC-type lipoprotein release transport system permease subunit
MIWSIAWRNIWRNRLRSGVVILAVALGLFGTLFMIALSNGMVEQKIADSVNNEISHIQIHNPQFMQDQSLKFPIEGGDSLVKAIAQDSRVKGVTSRIKTMAMASTAVTGAGVMINGIEPEAEMRVTGIHSMLLEGNYFEKVSSTPSILISKKLAGKLKAKTGSKIVITIQNMEGDLVYGLFRVAGLYKTSNAMFDEPNVFVRKSDLAALTGFAPAGATEIAVLLQRTDDTDSMVPVLQALAPGESVLPWNILEPTLRMLSSMMDQMSYFLLIIILAAMAFGIVNTMLMSILERTRELGMLMAVGMNHRRVFLMIMLETIFLALVGCLAGVALSLGTITITSRTGINFAAWAEGLESLGYSALVYPKLYASLYVGLAILVIVTAIISSLYPARKALSLKPAEAVRHDA